MNERRYHHLGLVATQPMKDEYYIDDWKVSLTPYDDRHNFLVALSELVFFVWLTQP